MPHSPAPSPRPVRRLAGWRLIVVVFMSVFAVGTSSWAASASWTAAPVTLAGSAAAASVSVTSTVTTPPTGQFAVRVTSPPVTETTHLGAFTYANTGTAPLALTVAATNTNGTLAANIAVTFWSASTAALCGSTVPASGTTSGALTGALTLPADFASVPAGSSLALCVALRLTTTTAASQGQTVTATFTLTGRVGANWSATAASAITQSVYRVPDPGTVTCTNGTGTSTDPVGTVTLAFPRAVGATSYNVVRASTPGTVIVNAVPPDPNAPTIKVNGSQLGVLSLGSVPILVQAVDGTYGTVSAGSPYTLNVVVLGLLGLRC